jgi:hypothetical protein
MLNPFLVEGIIIFFNTGVPVCFCVKFMPTAALTKIIPNCWLRALSLSHYCEMYRLQNTDFQFDVLPRVHQAHSFMY